MHLSGLVAAAMPPNSAPLSHEEFLLRQTRQNVEQLAASGALDSILVRQLESLLSTATIRAPEPPARAERAVATTEKEKLSAKNKWTREVLANSDVLPSLVDAALSVAAGPLLSSSQRASIVQIVSMSQERIAKAITDPARQRAVQNFTTSSAKIASTGLMSGVQNAGQNWDKWNKKRDQEAEVRRTEREEKKALKNELEREREQFARSRTGSVADDTDSAMASMSLSSKPSSAKLSGNESISLAADNPSAASVVALPSENTTEATTSDALAQTGAVTTTFTPWPGLVLTSTIVASSGQYDVAALMEANRALPPAPPRDGPLPPPPGPNVPPPPPRHTSSTPAPASPVAPPPQRIHSNVPQGGHPAQTMQGVPMQSYSQAPPPPPYMQPSMQPQAPPSLRPGTQGTPPGYTRLPK